MNERLTVEIDARVANFKRGLKEAEGALSDFEKSVKKGAASNQKIEKAVLSVDKVLSRNKQQLERLAKTHVTTSKAVHQNAEANEDLDKSIDKVTSNANSSRRGFDNLGKGANRAEQSMGELGKTTSVNATPAMIAFTGIMQDAPYGIRGVANNIEFFTTSMLNLSRQTGSGKGALKALLGTLTGPTGILFAVSAVSSLLVVFGDDLFDSGEEAKNADEKLQDYIDSLKGVNKAQLNASVSAAKEMVQLKLLTGQATNAALATDERKAAVNELRKLYPEYLKGMTDEQILAKGLSTAYADVTRNIMRKAKAQAASNVMVDNLEQEVRLNRSLQSIESEIASQRQKNADLLKRAQEIGGQNTLFREAAKGEEKVNKLLEDRIELQGKIQSRQLENIDLEQSVKASGDLIVTPENVEVDDTGNVKVDPIRVPVELQSVGSLSSGTGEALLQMQLRIKDQIEDLQNLQKTIPEVSAQYSELGEQISLLEGILERTGDAMKTPAQLAADMNQEGLERFKQSSEAMREEMQRTNEFANIFASSVGSAISEMGNEMQRNLVRNAEDYGQFAGVIKHLSGVIINTLAQMASQLIQQAITEKLVGQGIKRVEQGKASAKGVTIATNAALAAGPAGMALLPSFIAGTQGMIQGAFAGIEAFANGTSMVGDSNLARVNRGEMILNNRQQRNMFNQLNSSSVGAVSANNLVVEVVGSISGETIRLSAQRAEQRMSRIGSVR